MVGHRGVLLGEDSPKNAGVVGRTGGTRRWGRGLDQRRGSNFRKAMLVVVVVGASWGNHEAMWL